MNAASDIRGRIEIPASRGATRAAKDLLSNATLYRSGGGDRSGAVDATTTRAVRPDVHTTRPAVSLTRRCGSDPADR